MNDQEMRDLSDGAICDKCGKPNIIWQSWRELFICGHCSTAREPVYYTPEDAQKLKMLTKVQYELMRRRRKQAI